MNTWLKQLSSHYDEMRNSYPYDRLLVLFDIDGTILDMRYMIDHILRTYDQEHDTTYFRGFAIDDFNIHENHLGRLLARLNISDAEKKSITDWYDTYLYSSSAILLSHKPFSGVMEVIRWFQLQPNTYVGLNTGRSESLRHVTLGSLNKVGENFKVKFENELLFMNPSTPEKNVPEEKVNGVLQFQQSGFRVFAMVDNEPENLKAISAIDDDSDILMLHADTIFESVRRSLPASTISGKTYDITELIKEKALPQHIQFVWHGVNDEANLRHFLGSNIQWAECDVRILPSDHRLILRHDSFADLPLLEGEDLFELSELLQRLNRLGRSIKIDFKENGPAVDSAIRLLQSENFPDNCLWFNGEPGVLQEESFRRLKNAFPNAIIQCPIDNYAAIILNTPERAEQLLLTLSNWGINRFSIKWGQPNLWEILDFLDRLHYEANIYNVPDLESFLKAVLLMPTSITSDFNFPKWHYFGRGCGERQKHYEYTFSDEQNANMGEVIEATL